MKVTTSMRDVFIKPWCVALTSLAAVFEIWSKMSNVLEGIIESRKLLAVVMESREEVEQQNCLHHRQHSVPFCIIAN